MRSSGERALGPITLPLIICVIVVVSEPAVATSLRDGSLIPNVTSPDYLEPDKHAET